MSEKLINNKFMWWIIVFISFIALNLFFGEKLEETPVWCDAVLYWQLGKDVWINGSFSIFSISSPLRGTIIPIIYGMMYYIGNYILHSETGGFILGSSLIYATFFSLIIPNFVRFIYKRCNIYLTYGVLILSFFFWYGLFLYPISDVLALIFTMAACCGVYRVVNANNHKSRILYGFLTGWSSYCAYNIRSIYMFSVFVIILTIIFKNKNTVIKLVLCLCSIIAGILTAAIPQILYNKYYFDVYSIKNMAASGIVMAQLGWGLTTQRYETYAGIIGKEAGTYPNYGIVFEDLIGVELLRQANIESFQSFGQYISFCFQYFFDVIGIYTRHLFSFLCPCYPELLVENINRRKTCLCIFNALILYFSGYTIYFYRNKILKSTFIKNNFPYLLIVIIPCIAILPGAPELRFFFPVYVLLYIVFMVGILNKGLLNKFISKLYWHIIGFCAFLAPIWCIWGETFANMRYIISLFSK